VLNDAVEDFWRQALTGSHAPDEGGRFAPFQPAQRQRRHMRLPHPWGQALRPERHNHQNREAWGEFNHAIKKFE
jgi:hypothetical protein